MSNPEVSEEQSWREEAEAVVADIRDYVQSVSVSEALPNSCKRIYINVTTLEKDKFCIELTGRGFRIVGKDYDTTEAAADETFETPYSLLDSISPKYRDSFGRALQRKLNRLKEEETNDGS